MFFKEAKLFVARFVLVIVLLLGLFGTPTSANAEAANGPLPAPRGVAVAGTYEDTHVEWVYSVGDWTAYSGSGPSGNNSHYTGTVGANAQVQFNGQGFILTYSKHPNYGTIRVLVDGGVALDTTINAHSSSLVWRATYTSPPMTAGVHTIEFRHQGPAGTYIELDAIQIMSAPGTVGAGMYDDTDFNWTYTGSWTRYSASGPVNNTGHYTGTVGDRAEITFHGTRFNLIYVKYPSYGTIRVTVDGGVPVTINTYSSTLVWRATYTSPLYALADHTVVIEHFGPVGKYIDIDAIQIFDNVPPPPATAGFYDDTDSHWFYNGGWAGYTASGPSLNTSHYTRTVGDYAELEFTGDRFVLLYSKFYTYGSFKVYIDGVETATINSYSSKVVWKATYTSPPLVAGDHTVRITHVGGTNKIIDIDGIQVLNATTAGTGIYDDVDTHFIYVGGGWVPYTAVGPAYNTGHYTNTVGNEARITFVGTRFILMYAKFSTYGLIDVYVDGVKVDSIDTYSKDLVWRATWTSPVFATGTHTVRLVHGAGGNFIDIDTIQFLP